MGNYWLRRLQRGFSDIIVIVVSCILELGVKFLLMEILNVIIVEYIEIRLCLNWKFFFVGWILQCWRVLCEVFREICYQQFYLVIDYINYSINISGKMCNSDMIGMVLIICFFYEFKVFFGIISQDKIF